MFQILERYQLSILILLQRTELQRKYKSPLLGHVNILSGGTLSFLRVLKQALNHAAVLKAYEDGEMIKKQAFDTRQLIHEMGFTKDSSFHLADIGCGIGGYHKDWLSEYPKGSVLLVDQTKFNFSSIFYGHGKPNRHYTNLRLAKKYLVLPGTIEQTQIEIVDKRKIEDKLKHCEIVVSFFSLGFHYSIETYWDSIWNHTNVKALLLDIRINSESQNFLTQKAIHDFKMIKTPSSLRSVRYLITRPD